MTIKNTASLVILLLTSACAEHATKSTDLIPIEERHAPIEIKRQSSNQQSSNHKKKAVDIKKESVITALLNDAQRFEKQGQSEKAAAVIERALRIEPKNALLWHRLAVVRMQQQQWQQAIIMARKSIALAATNKQLKSDNWALIAAAYDNLGNKQKANEAGNKQSGQA